MNGVLQGLEQTVAGIPLPVLEVWGWLSYIIGIALAVAAFGGFTFRLGERWGFGRERQAWDAKALWCMPLTFVLIATSGYFGSFIVLVPGAQTFESLKDLVVFLCVVLFGYPALITVPFAYGLADVIEGVPPEFLWGWWPGYFINPACFWIAYQLIGKNPDFRLPGTWPRYLVFVALFMSLEPVLWGFICSDRFTPAVSYRQVTSALVFTTSVTWVIAPLAMLAALPLARSLGLFWAEIGGHVKERALGRRQWLWEAGRPGGGERSAAAAGIPIRLFILMPFIGLVLVMVGTTAYVTLRSAEDDAEKLAVRLHEEISENIGLRLNEQLARGPHISAEQISQLLAALPIARHGSALLIDRSGKLVASSLGRTDPIVENAALNLQRVAGDLRQLRAVVQFRFDHLVAKPLSRETWLAHAAPRKGDERGTDWVVMTIMPEAFYLAGVRVGNSRSAMVFAVALVLSLGVAAMLGSKVTGPLRDISEAACALADGSMTARVPNVHLEELGILTRSFNDMAAQLQASFDKLSSEVETRKRRERELEQSEERLRSSENRIQLAVRAASLGVWDWDVQRDELHWDDSMYRLYGVDKGEFGRAYDAWSKCLLPEDAAAARADVEAALRGDKEFESEFRVRRSDGAVRSIRGTGRTIRDADGRPLRMVGINWDVTDRRRSEAERGKLLHDLGERVKELRLLHAASRLLQRDRPLDRALLEELVVQLPPAWQYPECCAARISYLDITVSTPGFCDSRFRQLKTFATRDGTGTIEVIYTEQRPEAAEGPFLVEERALIDSLGEMLVGYLELRKREESLEALVRERTIALSHAKEQAETANRAKSTFLATMSHEIRTPMNAILGFGQLLSRASELTPRDRDRLEKLLRNGYHLLELINNVLEMSRIEAGRSEASLASFDLHRAIADVEGMVRERLEAKGLAFIVQGIDTLPRHVQTDEAKLRQILINLLGNAAKFTDAGSVTLSLQATPAGDRVALAFRVEDTGAGMAPDELEQIFEPFQQARSGIRNQTGTGLGLAISRDFARLLGGELRVKSELGRGSTFVLEVMAEAVAGSEIRATGVAFGQVAGLEPGQRIPTLLVVDDEADNRAVLSELLRAVGARVIEADDGSTALDMTASHRPDLVFMDVKMRGMSGVEAVRRIRATEAGKSIPIIILSASALRDERTSMLSTGADDFVAKPFREVEIWTILERHLGLRFVYKPAPTSARPDPAAPTREQVLALGADTVQRLREAIELGYVGRIPAILAQAEPEHRATVAALSELAQGLELQRLTKLL